MDNKPSSSSSSSSFSLLEVDKRNPLQNKKNKVHD